jgi:hypothetical protein
MILTVDTKDIPKHDPDTVGAIWRELRNGEAAEPEDYQQLHGLESDAGVTLRRVFWATVEAPLATPEIWALHIPTAERGNRKRYLLRQSHGATLHSTIGDAYDRIVHVSLDAHWVGTEYPPEHLLRLALTVYADTSKAHRLARSIESERIYVAANRAVFAAASLVLATADADSDRAKRAADVIVGVS